MGLLEKDDDRKPLFRKWYRDQKKAGVPEEEIACIIKTVRFSGSGEWLILDCDEATAMINAESKAGKSFWEFVSTLEGTLKALVVIPAKGKLGFDVIPSDNLTGEWVQEKNDEKVTFCLPGDEPGSSGTFTRLTMENMQPSSQSSVPTTKKSRKSGGES